jgi:hypothetical protein
MVGTTHIAKVVMAGRALEHARCHRATLAPRFGLPRPDSREWT